MEDGRSLGQTEALAANTAAKVPKRYKVILLNDDYTPMDFVVEVLQAFFNLGGDKATTIMWQIHTKGKGSCGSFTKDVAETKVHIVNNYAREHEHPLMCIMEPEQNNN